MFNNRSANPNQQQAYPESPQQRTVFERRTEVAEAVHNAFSISNINPASLAGAIYPAKTISEVESSNLEKPAAAAGMAVVDAAVSIDHSEDMGWTILKEKDPFEDIENAMLIDNLYADAMQSRESQELADA